MNNDNISVGFNIAKEGLSWTILEKKKDNKIEIKDLDIYPFFPVLDYDNFFSQTNRNNIFETLNQIQIKSDFKNYNCNLSIDSRHAFITKSPIDRRLNDSEIEKHLDWEFSVLMNGDKKEDYIITHTKLYTKRPSRPTASLVLFLRKNIVSFFNNIFEDEEIHLNVIDFDHFALENVCKLNYSEFITKNSIIISVKDSSIELSFIKAGEYFNYRLINFSETSEVPEILDKEFRQLSEKQGNIELSNIYIFAPYLRDSLLSAVKSVLPKRAEQINPFKNLIINKNVLGSQVFKSSNLFSPSVGMSLRNLIS